jgi:hypothetical protein
VVHAPLPRRPQPPSRGRARGGGRREQGTGCRGQGTGDGAPCSLSPTA